MALIKFDRFKILYGDIKPEKVVPIKYQPYTKNVKGATVVDLNVNELSDQRKLLSLHTTKTSQIKFNQVIDIEFQDFPIQSNNNAIDLLQSRLGALIGEKNSLLNERDTNRDKIDELNKVIEDLRKQLQAAINDFGNFNPKTGAVAGIINEIPDQLALNATLYSDRKGNPGNAGYPLIQNQLLSRGRKAKLLLQDDGNVVITKGDYDGRGNPIAPDEIVISFAWDNGASAPNYLKLTRIDESRRSVKFEVGGFTPIFDSRWESPTFEGVSNKARLILDDIGSLSIYDADRLVWSTYGIDPAEDQYNVGKKRASARVAAEAAARAAAEAERKRIQDEEERKRKEEEDRRNRNIFTRAGAAIGDAARATGQGISNAAQAVGSAVSSAARSVGQGIKKLFRSDRELKTDIKLIGQSPSGINIYEFKFKKDLSRTYQGVIADELLNTPYESALYTDDEGFLAVDYNQIDVDFKQTNLLE